MPAERPRPDRPELPRATRPSSRSAAQSARTPPQLPTSRGAAVAETAGALTGTYEPDELKTLRDDWPA